jgi:calcineurin-like phosphoesterase family protein
MDWFTADLHLGHTNIINYCGRPFANTDAMDGVMIANLNACLSPGDRLFILGDFCGQRRKAPAIRSYLARINCPPGQIHFILGNHDNEKETRKVFPNVYVRYTYKGKYHKAVLDHYALRTWNGSFHGRWHLYGHSHGTLFEDPSSLSFDVWVDTHDFKPWSYTEVREKMLLKMSAWMKAPDIDHHRKRIHGFDKEEDHQEEDG